MWCDFILPVVVCGCVHVARESHSKFKDHFVRVYLMQSRQSVLVDQIGADATVEELPCWKKHVQIRICYAQTVLNSGADTLWLRKQKWQAIFVVQQIALFCIILYYSVTRRQNEDDTRKANYPTSHEPVWKIQRELVLLLYIYKKKIACTLLSRNCCDILKVDHINYQPGTWKLFFPQ